MKKTMLIILFVTLYVGVMPALSVPAAPRILTLEQADGFAFKAKLWGDENGHGTETIDGYSIVLDEKTKEWNYAKIDAEGHLVSSKNSVRTGSPPVNVQKHLRSTANTSSIKASRAKAFSQEPDTPGRTANIPVILINFADRNPTFDASSFETLLFGSGVKSMRDYYEEVSSGVFTVSSGPGGVAGWYTASKGHDYYGQNDPVLGYDMYTGTLVREAVAGADKLFNFAPYDLNGDCYVDVVDLVHQGSGEEAGGPSTDIWSHSWDLNNAYYFGYSDGGEYVTNDACISGGHIKVNAYVIQPETLGGGQQTIGVFTHEYGHSLGAPDLYDTDYSSHGIGDWSLMAYGSWNGIVQQGDTPAHMDAWTKSLLGWVDPAIINENNLTTIKQVENNKEVYQLLTGPGEYFLVENRQKVGFDAALPGEGLLIWHIDETQSNNANDATRLVDLEEADGNDIPVQSTDPWRSNMIGFTQSTNPNSRLYSGSDSGVRVTEISDSGSTMTAYFTISSQPGLTIVSPNGGETWQRNKTKTIRWTSSGNPGSNVTIELLKNGTVNKIIAPVTENDGSFIWKISSSQTRGSDYRIRIISTSNGAYTDTSDGKFRIS